MRALDFDFDVVGRPPRFLFVGAHSDDIEIGCGGTVIELLRRNPGAEITWVVMSSGRGRSREARRAARLFLGKAAARATIVVENFEVSYFPAQWSAVKRFLETLKLFEPDVVFAHCRDELHQDHRVIGELVWNTFRDHVILEYEIPKFDGGLGSPAVFVPLAPATVKRKVDVLMKVFGTQRSKQWFTASTFEGLMRLHGIECNAPHGYAEAFYIRKLVLATGTRPDWGT